MRDQTKRHERGAALVELAITAPLFLALIYGSLYLTDIGVFKLKAQEAARHAAWSFTQYPLSDYENFRHPNKFNDARDAVTAEMSTLYEDLEGAIDRPALLPGKYGQTAMAMYQEPTSLDLRNRPVGMLPEWAQIQWAEPLSEMGMILSLLGVGTGSESFVSGPFQRLKLNHMGQVSGRAQVIMLPPIRPGNTLAWLTAQAMAKVGKDRGADLTAWLPRLSGTRLRDTGGGPIEVTLVADSWRVTEGFSAHPKHEGDYSRVVGEINERAVSALPGGSILNFLLNLGGGGGCGLGALSGLQDLTGLSSACPEVHLFSRPYIAQRNGRAYTGSPQPGQSDIFRYTGGQAEGGAVVNFETGALYDDPDNLDGSPYLKALNDRGPYFMGCDRAEERGCWE
ncbi:MAG: pilus assembly protein [Deltaproteobacteria bacterium]|nr:pilus assembly protein [Deltaproteobacteria bacterium]